LGPLIRDVRLIETDVAGGRRAADESVESGKGLSAAIGSIRAGDWRRFLWAALPDRMYQLLQNVYDAWLGRPNLESYDLVHLTLPSTARRFIAGNEDILVTVHDLCHLVCPEFVTGGSLEIMHDSLDVLTSKTEVAFLSVSETTKAELVRRYDVDPGKIRVIHEGTDRTRFHKVEDSVALAQVRATYGVPQGPYLLTLSTIEPRKNLANSIRAFLRICSEDSVAPLHMVIAGRIGWKVDELFGGLERSDRVRFVGYIDENHLAALYSGALALSYVSHYEGFGLPPLEAMACGVPVIYGANSSMPEVIGDAGLPADATSVEAIAAQYLRIATDATLRERLASRALERAAELSSGQMVHDTVALYREIIDRRGDSAQSRRARPR
jgi:glycosyltransferase involved in cell wall biosynthesis